LTDQAIIGILQKFMNNSGKQSWRKFFILGFIAVCFLFPGIAQSASGEKYLSRALYYQTLVDFTCKLQIDYYKEFSAYLERTKASGRPVLIPYYIGMAYFETGRYVKAARFFKEASVNLAGSGIATSIKVYKYYSEVMLAACLYRRGEKESLAKLTRKGLDKIQGFFLGYVLIRLNYRIDRAKKLLAGRPDNLFGEATDKWINYKLGASAIKGIRIAKHKLKKAEFVEKYDRIKLNSKNIPLYIKYFNPAEISLLKEIYLYKALESLDSRDLGNFASLGRINYLFGNYKKAIGYLKDYKKAFPLDLSASILLGRCYYAADYPEKADRLWDWVERSGGVLDRRELALTLSEEKLQDTLGLVKKIGGKMIGENLRFDAAYYRKHKDYYLTLGRVYLNLDKFKDAAASFMLTYERSRKEQPKTYDQTYLLCLGYALAEAGRLKESIDYAFKGAASLNPAAYQAFHAVNYGLYMLKYE
jgi:tetratricopeptide (TPR) repeat protein